MTYLYFYGALALWVLFDSIDRKLGNSSAVWCLGTFVLGPIVLPLYLSKRPLKINESREGGTAWNFLKNFAILWTVLMATISISTVVGLGEAVSEAGSDAGKAGAGVGFVLGMGVLGSAWFLPTAGAALLGFLLKTNSGLEKGPTGPLIDQKVFANRANGWTGLAGSAVFGLILGLVIGTPRAKPAVVKSASSHIHGWQTSESTDPMDGTKRTTLMLVSDDKVNNDDYAHLIVRCEKGRMELYVNVGGQVEIEDAGGHSVRTKFDDGPPSSGSWYSSDSGDALFAPVPSTIVKQLEDTTIFLFEFVPFQRTAKTVSFKVLGLREKLQPILETCGYL